MTEVILYHIPPSFYSQVARLALAEKGVGYTSRFVAMDMYAPGYMRLNPAGTVPMIVHHGHPVPGSIARYVDANFEGPPLISADEEARAGMERWIKKFVDISVRELSYGTGKAVKFGPLINRFRVRVLKRHQRENPDMAEVYRAKQKDIEGFSSNSVDAAHVEKIRGQVRECFDGMEALLSERPWLCGERYTLADVVWTVMAARLKMIKFDQLPGRPAVAAWYQRAKARPSFQTADIWEFMKPWRMLGMVLEKFGLRLAMILPAVIGLAALAWWLIF